ncbi:MAG: asparaginase [Clostridia bacterium]|nr:asparaginase [Clostridia bacterium]
MSVKLVEVTRGKVVESVHRGDVVVINTDGQILFYAGDPEKFTYMRSAAKPLQAITALEVGSVERYNLDLREIALMVASHSGEKEHISNLRNAMEKIGIEEKVLECGIHEPTNREAAKELIAAGKNPTKLHCNCSGKHIGLIAASEAKGFPIEGYQTEEHSVQKEVEKVIAEFCRADTNDIMKGIDGCGVPVYALPIKNMAVAYANLCNSEFLHGKYRKAQNYILSAMTMYPEMVAGTGKLDTILMKNFGDRVIGKTGAEGVYCAGIIGKAIGIAIKIEDGNSRAVGPVIFATLLQMGIIDQSEVEKVKDFWNPPILNHRGEKVGEIKAVFSLEK